MTTWQPFYGDVGIKGVLDSLDTFCGQHQDLCGSHLVATIWGTWMTVGGLGGSISPAGRQLIGKLVDAEIAAESSIVYRVIRADENPALGLTAKNPLATYTPEGHVLNGSRPGFASQYISTTTELSVAEKWAAISGDRIVGINLDAVGGPVIDLSTPAGRELYLNGITARNFAAASSEVLVQGYIPPEAMFEVPPVEVP